MQTINHSRTLALALAVVLGAGCDAGTGSGEVSAHGNGGEVPPAAGSDTAVAPTLLPPPVAGPGPDGDDGTADRETVPSRFLGSYAADQAACDTPGNPTRLAIDSDAITFHESSGPVTQVASEPPVIAITAELTGEGETREATYRFRLSDDGQVLTDLDGGMERVRCG